MIQFVTQTFKNRIILMRLFYAMSLKTCVCFVRAHTTHSKILYNTIEKFGNLFRIHRSTNMREINKHTRRAMVCGFWSHNETHHFDVSVHIFRSQHTRLEHHHRTRCVYECIYRCWRNWITTAVVVFGVQLFTHNRTRHHTTQRCYQTALRANEQISRQPVGMRCVMDAGYMV